MTDFDAGFREGWDRGRDSLINEVARAGYGSLSTRLLALTAPSPGSTAEPCPACEARDGRPENHACTAEPGGEPTDCAECGCAVSSHDACYGACKGNDGMGCDCPGWVPRRLAPKEGSKP